ncbi:hypothetical protein C8R48DRAFT_674378 [Suillus tomentosus]|nr:hypothetical protein C8R48DRAFT_674378 [Suillus tomentosus]
MCKGLPEVSVIERRGKKLEYASDRLSAGAALSDNLHLDEVVQEKNAGALGHLKGHHDQSKELSTSVCSRAWRAIATSQGRVMLRAMWQEYGDSQNLPQPKIFASFLACMQFALFGTIDLVILHIGCSDTNSSKNPVHTSQEQPPIVNVLYAQDKEPYHFIAGTRTMITMRYSEGASYLTQSLQMLPGTSHKRQGISVSLQGTSTCDPVQNESNAGYPMTAYCTRYDYGYSLQEPTFPGQNPSRTPPSRARTSIVVGTSPPSVSAPESMSAPESVTSMLTLGSVSEPTLALAPTK